MLTDLILPRPYFDGKVTTIHGKKSYQTCMDLNSSMNINGIKSQDFDNQIAKFLRVILKGQAISHETSFTMEKLKFFMRRQPGESKCRIEMIHVCKHIYHEGIVLRTSLFNFLILGQQYHFCFRC